MSIDTAKDVAMVLPIPVQRDAGEKAVRFFNFSRYGTVFDDLHLCFPQPRAYQGSPNDPFAGSPSEVLAVVSVGAYDASYVPSIADFSRLDEQFRLPPQVWDKLPGYATYGFAVFKLKAGRRQEHPMAFSFPTALPGHVFFPTMHIHDGQVHDREHFDHTLYLQGDHLALTSGWDESIGIAQSKVKWLLTHGMIRPEMHVRRLKMQGSFRNGDIVIKPRT